MSEFTMTIDGIEAATEKTFSVVNPATGEVVGEAPEPSRAQVDQAMNAAARAFQSWQFDRSERQKGLEDLATAVEVNLEELAEVITMEEGKPLRESRSELGDVVNDLRYFATLDVPAEIVRDDARTAVRVLRRPIGPVAAITPWNFPLGTAIAKIAPALSAGCTVVLKPSPYTPLSCLRFGELVRSVLPAGVLSVISGSNDVGTWMTEHPVPRMISFTGSVATGKRVASSAANDLKRVTLELGGNDPAIVLDDAVIEDIVDGLFANAFSNCGQVCVAVKRVYVPNSLHDELVEALASRAKAVKVGDGRIEASDIGPLCNQMQFDRVSELVGDAASHGARFAAGGHAIDGPGHFFEPTIVTDVSDGLRLVDEEQFGPVLPIIRYDNIDDVLQRANATHFGLGASIWTSDIERGSTLAPRVDAGTVWVNTHQSAVPGQPFGGMKWSGIGVEGGPWGLLSFTEVQAIHVATS
jgi:acyl-CoA reductase-like NAD-dependent aldehyde dehydrogenase